ncbi:MAG: gephyrin-like molybdotransferase Glp [Pyrinomonadaceae bacterium]
MIAIPTAFRIIDSKTGCLGTEKISLEKAIDRLLAEDVAADSDMPPFDRSQMDGYAVRARDTTGAPVTLRIVGESAAGRSWRGRLASGQAVRIMTGARVPMGADAIQKIELTAESEEVVRILAPTVKGRHIVTKGREVRSGKIVLRRGERVSVGNIAVLAAFGHDKVLVTKRPRVGIVSTGSEIVEIGKKPLRDQIRDSNSIMLSALCRDGGADVTTYQTVGDDLQILKTRIASAALQNDILVTSGGVSVGKYDLTKTALQELGAEILFDKVRLKPGKPTVFAKLGRTLVLSLAGNPVSAAVTYHLFVRRAILRLQAARQTGLITRTAILTGPAKSPRERAAYLPCLTDTDSTGTLAATLLNWHGSSDFIGFSRATALVVVPRNKTYVAGDLVKILLL